MVRGGRVVPVAPPTAYLNAALGCESSTLTLKLPAELVAKVQAKEKAILAGSFSVKVDDSQPKANFK